VLPGGRFREIYYWDSYFTQLGLVADQEKGTFTSMVKIFNKMLIKYGRIFNGSRKYYQARSQPPYFALMVALWQSESGAPSATQFLPALKKEYEFWMAGAETLAPGEATARVVKLDDGTLLNRYWNDKAVPRPEAYKEDVEIARLAAGRRTAEDIYRDISAAAESGWDFSTRWLANPEDFTTIQTTSLAPIDLNSLLAFLESKIAELSRVKGDLQTAEKFTLAAQKRTEAIHKYFFADGSFRDYNWQTRQVSPELTIAMVTPLFLGVARPAEAQQVLKVVNDRFLAPGGVRTTLRNSEHQWDGKNGWAPNQWQAYVAAVRYQHVGLAENIRKNWLRANDVIFAATGELKEKYNVENLITPAGGGEYEPQFGFGWSNGTRKAFENPTLLLRHLLGNVSPILH
jgi:alpha,alpha-trehalase